MVSKSWLLTASCIFLIACSSEPTTAQTKQDLPTSIPNLSGYDSETRRTMELACGLERSNGPVAYGACLNRQTASLQSSHGIPNQSGYDSETRQTALPTSRSGGANSDESRSGGTAVHSVNAMSRFTSENIMKVHQGMGSNKILEMFG